MKKSFKGHFRANSTTFCPNISEFDETWYVGSTYGFIIPGEVLLILQFSLPGHSYKCRKQTLRPVLERMCERAQMLGKKDFVSIRKNGQRFHMQKPLVLNNLRELLQELKEKFLGTKIGF